MGLRQFDFRQSGQKRLESDLRFAAGERGADADVAATPKTEVPIGLAVEGEAVRLPEVSGIAIGRTEHQHHRIALADPCAADLQFLSSDTARPLHRAVESQKFLDRGVDQPRGRGDAVHVPIAFLLGFLSGPLVGLINGLLVTRLRINPLIATLSMLFVVRGVGFLIADSRLRQVRDPGFRFAREYVAGMPVAVYFLIAVFVFAFVLIRYTKFGRHIAAVGGNPEAARQAVMNVERYRLLFYTVSGAFAGLAGILLASIIGASDPNAGTGRELVVATAVFLGGASLTGGKGSIVGTLLGVLFVTTLANGLTQMGAPPQYVPIVLGILLIGAVAIDQRPKGGYR